MNDKKTQSINTFQNFYSRIGLTEYPFSTYTTENEKDVFSSIFIKPSTYDTILSNFLTGNSMILTGDRGTGKTAIIKDFISKKQNKDTVLICIEDFSELDINYDAKAFYKFLIKAFATQLLLNLAEFPKRVKLLNDEEKLLISYLIKDVIPQISKKKIKEKIEKIQLSGWIRTYKIVERFFRGLLNYSVSTIGYILDDYISKHIPGLPPLTNTRTIKEYFPEVPLTFEDDFETQEHSSSFFNTLIKISIKMGFTSNIIMFDRIDEDDRFQNDAEQISNFIVKMLTDNKLLASETIQVIFSLWSTPFNFIKDHVRTQKHYCPVLDWSREDLETALNKRLSFYSDGKIFDFEQIFTSEVGDEEYDLLFEIANSNPRDLWHLFNQLLITQFKTNRDSKGIQKRTIYKALNDFVTRFNYFEYYPKKSKSRRNSMDIYSYSKHLLKLKSEYFTKNELDTHAGTGGSTNNYVVGMEKIGLISQHSQKQGAAVYKIKDPKIIYAQKKGLEIRNNMNI